MLERSKSESIEFSLSGERWPLPRGGAGDFRGCGANDLVVKAEQRVREAEHRVAQQLAVVARLKESTHVREAALAKRVLVIVRQALELAREHLHIERQIRGLGP